jgi:sporulation protein YlmC with PRC-barrel domain
MVRKLLATTAMATLLATGAMAQTAPAPAQPAPASPGMTQPAESQMVKKAEGYLASNIIGETVYNGAGDDAENIGEVNDIILGADGQIKAVVVGVGGFLGIGEKNVALEWNVAQWVERDNDEFLVIETTEEALTALPEFDLAAYEFGPADQQVGQTEPATADDLNGAQQNADAAAATDGETDEVAAAPAPMTTAPAATEAPADQTAAAPATEEKPAGDMAAAPAQPAPANGGAAPAAPADTMAQAPAAQPTDEVQTGAIDRSSLNAVEMGQVRTEDFVGTTVYGANDENVGEVGDVIMSTDGKTVDAVILDVGGFLGMGEKEVALGLDNLTFMADADGEMYVYTNLTKEQLEAQAAYDETGYEANRDNMRLVVPN